MADRWPRFDIPCVALILRRLAIGGLLLGGLGLAALVFSGSSDLDVYGASATSVTGRLSENSGRDLVRDSPSASPDGPSDTVAFLPSTPTPTPIPTPCGSDFDGDNIDDCVDNCPAWANPTQDLPPWPVPSGDDDCDGQPTSGESFMGTLPFAACAADTTPTNEEPDAWPSDADDDQDTDIGDFVRLFGSGKFLTDTDDSLYDPRSDFDGDADIDSGDVIYGFGEGKMLTTCGVTASVVEGLEPGSRIAADMIPSGNSSGSLGPLDHCVSVSGGASLVFDVVLDGFPAGMANLAGFNFAIQPAASAGTGNLTNLQVVSVENFTTGINILTNEGTGLIFDLSTPVPSPLDGFQIAPTDLGSAEGPPTTTEGVLTRFTVSTAGVANGLYAIDLEGGLGVQLFDIAGTGYAPDEALDGDDGFGLIEVGGGTCPPAPTPTPEPSVCSGYPDEAALVADNRPECRATFIYDAGQGNYLSRQDLLDNAGYFTSQGFSMNFLWYAPGAQIQVDSGDPRTWSSCQTSTQHLGQTCPTSHTFHSIRNLVFSEDVTLNVWLFEDTFMSKACGNFNQGARDSPVPKISGYKFSDLNADGSWDPGEPPVSGWVITLYDPDGAAYPTQVTGSDGYYEFSITTRPGMYQLVEESSVGWIPTTNQSLFVYVPEGSGDSHFAGNDFGNYPVAPTTTPSPTSTPTPTATPTTTPSPTPPTPTDTPTPTPTLSPTSGPSPTPTPSVVPTTTPTPTPSPTPSQTPTASVTPTPTAAPTATGTPVPAAVGGTVRQLANPVYAPMSGSASGPPIVPLAMTVAGTSVFFAVVAYVWKRVQESSSGQG